MDTIYANIETGEMAPELPAMIQTTNASIYNPTIEIAKSHGWRRIVSEEAPDPGFTVKIWKFDNITGTTCRREIAKAEKTVPHRKFLENVSVTCPSCKTEFKPFK